MRFKLLFTTVFFVTTCFLIVACNNESKKSDTTTTKNDSSNVGNNTSTTNEAAEVHGTEVKEGEIKYETPLNAAWVSNGKSIYELKCQSCHKLDDQRVVGPGWKGVTKKREPEWIVNMITNVEMMLETDPEAQKLLEQCLVRMPNQNITKDEARQIIEFMRSNDGEK